MELNDVQPSEVAFEEELFRSMYSLIYLVTIRGQKCVMKVVSALDRPAHFDCIWKRIWRLKLKRNCEL
jgi:hypothetical protein